MRKLIHLVTVALALFAFSGLVVLAQESSVTMNEQNGSGQTGMAMLTDMGDGTTRVVVTISNGTTSPQPAHIHPGTCATLEPRPQYPLTSLVNGTSETMVPADIDSLTTGAFAINVHKSATEAAVYTSCGDIMALATGGGDTGGTTVGMPRTGSGDMTGLALLALLGLSLIGSGLTLARRKA